MEMDLITLGLGFIWLKYMLILAHFSFKEQCINLMLDKTSFKGSLSFLMLLATTSTNDVKGSLQSNAPQILQINIYSIALLLVQSTHASTRNIILFFYIISFTLNRNHRNNCFAAITRKALSLNSVPRMLSFSSPKIW